MAYNFPEGAKFLYSPLSGFATAKNITAVSNADPAVCTSAAHGYTTGKELLLQSNWEDMNDLILRATNIDTNSFSLQDMDTSDQTFFSPGGGAGSSAQEVGTWFEIPQPLTIAFNGGDARFTNVNPLNKRNGLSIPTGFNPTSINLGIGHDPANTTFKSMLKLSRSLKKVAFKLQMLTGAASYGFGYMFVSEAPAMQQGQVNTVPVVFTLGGRMTSYG
ncbi:MAG: hypothetical protein EOP37_03225 [Rubrivivax sp.]|nr:MAG: hypothetical protein EOP37_03225 [Rubrivivax sp.]